MSDMEITIRLPEKLAKEASLLGILTEEHIQDLLQADVYLRTQTHDAQLATMAEDPDIQNEIQQIANEFANTESDGW